MHPRVELKGLASEIPIEKSEMTSLNLNCKLMTSTNHEKNTMARRIFLSVANS
jgi:hypothetical protein